MGSGAARTRGKAAAGRPREVADCRTGQARLQLADPTAPHSRIDKPGGMAGERSRLHNPGIQHGKYEASKPLTVKTCGVAAVGETPSRTGEFVGETHRVLECTEAHPSRISTRRAQFACG